MFVLINPPGLKSMNGLQMHTPNPPLGLAYIASAIEQAGYKIKVIDAVGEAINTIKPYKPRPDLMVQGLNTDDIVNQINSDDLIVGISCMFSTLWPITRDIISEIKKQYPSIMILIGGEHSTAVPLSVLNTSPVDFVIKGEGEETIINLLKAYPNMNEIRKLNGVAYKINDVFFDNGLSIRNREIDKISWPAWHLFPIENYIDNHQINGVNMGRSMPLLPTRGCPYQCTFCSSPDMWTTRYVTRSPVDVVNEMVFYINKYNISNFDFQDLTAVVKRSWAVDFCNEIIRRDLNITWQMPSGTRSEVFDTEVADLLYKSGCRALAFAPESGSVEMLKIIKKQVDLDHLIDAAKISVKRGFSVSCFFVIGFPEETKSTLYESMKLIRKLAFYGISDVAVSKFIPYPGSELFKQLQNSGQISLDDKFFISPIDFYSSDAATFSKYLSQKYLYRYMIWMYVNFYIISFIKYPLRTINTLFKAVFLNVESTRFSKLFNDIIKTRLKWWRIANKNS